MEARAKPSLKLCVKSVTLTFYKEQPKGVCGKKDKFKAGNQHTYNLHHALLPQAAGAPACMQHYTKTYIIEPCLVLCPLEELLGRVTAAACLPLHGTTTTADNSIHNTQFVDHLGRLIIICAYIILIGHCYHQAESTCHKTTPYRCVCV